VTIGGGISRQNFVAAARGFVGLVDQIDPDRWPGPGLGEWDLRALVGHTSRSLTTVQSYLAQPAAAEDLTSAAAYLAAVADIDPASVAERGRAAGAALGDDPVATLHALVDRVLPLTERDDDPLVSTIFGGMRLSNYLPTRTFELVVHGLDIARAAGLATPDHRAEVLTEVLELTAAAAVLRGAGIEVLLALTGRADLRPGFTVV
jgi:uncharacterized protein (TIGR03083 family)